jgi:hypothetical protein
MGLVELQGIATIDGGPATVTAMDAWASFAVERTHNYDDRTNGLGCFADHYDAITNPLPPDKDAAILRMSGYAGGTLLSGESAGQPIVCMTQSGFYQCIYPSNAPANLSSAFAVTADPLGSGPVTFDTGSGADFGATFVQGSPGPTLALPEDLNSIQYRTGQSTTLHVTCHQGCASSNVSIRLEALAHATEGSDFPYPSLGTVRCTLPASAPLTLPSGALSAMYAGDARLDTVVSEAFLEGSQQLTATDAEGNPLSVETGRGLFGVSSQAP